MDPGSNLKIYLTERIEHAYGVEIARDWSDEILAKDDSVANFILKVTGKNKSHQIFTSIEIEDVKAGYSMNEDGTFLDLEDEEGLEDNGPFSEN